MNIDRVSLKSFWHTAMSVMLLAVIFWGVPTAEIWRLCYFFHWPRAWLQLPLAGFLSSLISILYYIPAVLYSPNPDRDSQPRTSCCGCGVSRLFERFFNRTPSEWHKSIRTTRRWLVIIGFVIGSVLLYFILTEAFGFIPRRTIIGVVLGGVLSIFGRLIGAGDASEDFMKRCS
jgi:hypothetical protein